MDPFQEWLTRSSYQNDGPFWQHDTTNVFPYNFDELSKYQYLAWSKRIKDNPEVYIPLMNQLPVYNNKFSSATQLPRYVYNNYDDCKTKKSNYKDEV